MECWTTSNTLGSTSTTRDTSIVQAGAGSLRGDAPFSAGAQTEHFEIAFPSDVNLSGKAIRCWVRVSSEVFGSGSCYVQLYGMDSSYQTDWSGWRTVTSAGNWMQVSFVFGTVAWNPAAALVIGVEFVSGTGATAGQVWVDEFEVYTPTGCVTPTFKPLYSYDSSDECWATANLRGSTTVSMDTASSYAGAGSLKASIPFTTGGEDEYLQIDFTSDGDMTNKALRCWVWFSPEVYGSGNAFIQLFAMDSSTFSWSGWRSVSSSGGWLPFTFTPTGINMAGIRRLGIQVIAGNGATAGDVWIDEYEIIDAPATPTQTPSGGCTVATLKALYNFDFDLECWSQGGNPSGTTMNKDSVVYQAGGGSMRLNVPYNLGQDAYAEINYPAVVDLTGKAIRCWVQASSQAYGASGAVSARVFTGTGAPTWSFYWGDYINIPTAGNWVSIGGTPTGIDLTQVMRVGVNIHSTGAATGDVWIDEVEVYTP